MKKKASNYKIKKIFSQGFTLVEIMLTVAILGILLMAVAPNFNSFIKAGESLSLKEKHKLVVIAVQEWTRDNKFSYQRPGDFKVKNSQDRTVVDYLSDNDFRYDPAQEVLVLTDEDCSVTFENGVMLTRNNKDNSVVKVYTVFEPENAGEEPENIRIADFDILRNIHHEQGETTEAYNLKIRNKDKKKLLLKEDNLL